MLYLQAFFALSFMPILMGQISMETMANVGMVVFVFMTVFLVYVGWFLRRAAVLAKIAYLENNIEIAKQFLRAIKMIFLLVSIILALHITIAIVELILEARMGY
jgi:hypothetical protein